MAFNNQFQEAEETLREVLSYSQNFGCETLGTPTSGAIGFILIANGQMSDGLKRMEDALMRSYKNHRKQLIATFEEALAQVSLRIVAKTDPIRFSVMAKNVGFLLRNVPSAGKKAEEHLMKAIDLAKEIRANTILGQALLDLGTLYKASGKNDEARERLNEAVQILERIDSEIYLNHAKENLACLG